ncbi:MAG: TRAP transporter small permease [Chloroflexi bacterium]|nr:TRAP transporter small permease [Chloroflexota bacterium]
MSVAQSRQPSQWRSLGGVIPGISVTIGSAGLSLMVVLVVAGVVSRKVFNLSIPFAIEYSEYLIPVIALWGAAYTLNKEGHVITDIVIQHVSKRARQWFLLTGYIAGLPYLVILIIFTAKLALANIGFHYVSMYATRTPLGYVQLAVPIGLALFVIQLLVEIIMRAKSLYLSYKG